MAQRLLLVNPLTVLKLKKHHKRTLKKRLHHGTNTQNIKSSQSAR